jgi:hypothetical protein
MKISFKIFTYRHTFQKHVLSYSGAVGWKYVNPSKYRSRFITVLFTK